MKTLVFFLLLATPVVHVAAFVVPRNHHHHCYEATASSTTSGPTFGRWTTTPTVVSGRGRVVSSGRRTQYPSSSSTSSLSMMSNRRRRRHHVSSSTTKLSSSQPTEEGTPKSSRNFTTLSKRVLYQGMNMFWKGITLPFPKLRELSKQHAQYAAKKKTKDSVSSSSFGIRECLLIISLYLSIGILAYTRIFEQWSIIDAIYFSVVTFTTVGYGDMSPSSLPSKIFTCIYGWIAIAGLGTAIAMIGTMLVETEELAIEQAQNIWQRNTFQSMIMKQKQKKQQSSMVNDDKESNDNNDDEQQNEITNDDVMNNATSSTNSTTATSSLFQPEPFRPLSLISSFGLLLLGGTIMGRLEGWTFMNTMYYTMITAGTMGYGDFSPIRQSSRLYAALFFLPLSVAAAGEILSTLASYLWINRKRRQVTQQIMKRKLSLEYLQAMDLNQNGRVSPNEFIQYMIVELGLVSKEQLQQIHLQFQSLDITKSGYLNQDDLKEMV